MAKREGRGNLRSFSRGTELWLHQAKLFFVALRAILIITALSSALTTGIYFWKATMPNEKYALERHLLAQALNTVPLANSKIDLNVNGRLYQIEAKEAIRLTEQIMAGVLQKFQKACLWGLGVALGAGVLVAFFLWRYGKQKITDKRLRGAQLLEGPELARVMHARSDASYYQIAGVPMRRNSETLHALFCGAPGTGKSQQFFAVMKQIRARGKRLIVYDPTGEYTQAFYREGKDILMNPLDARSPNWNIWHEVAKDYHFDNIANGLIPDPAEADPFWAKAGRMVLKEVFRVLGQKGQRTNQDLYKAIANSNLQEMYTLLQGTPGATYVDPLTERTGMSIKMTVQNQLESFRFLHDAGEPFSIRKWVQEEGDSWMFITARESMREALKPVLSLWVDIAIKAVLDLDPIHEERLWFSLDELLTLQKLDILKLAITNTRKYGLCFLLGMQDLPQFYAIYGRDIAKTIISGCQTKLLLRVTDGAAAKMMAELMGQVEIDEKEETLNYGLNTHRDGASVSGRRIMRDIVLTSEILTLPDMTGYLIVPGDYPIAKVQYDYVPMQKIAEGFVERNEFDIDFNLACEAQIEKNAI